jgi:putative sterol carrier protein
MAGVGRRPRFTLPVEDVPPARPAVGETLFPARRGPAPMPPAFFTQGYFEDLVKTLNGDAEFKQKAASMNLSVIMAAKDKGLTALLRIKDGQATVQMATPEEKADFKFLGDYATWAANHRGEAALDKLVMTGKLKFIGSIPKIMGLRSQLLVIDRLAQTVPAEM